jgi:hypothetical protein
MKLTRTETGIIVESSGPEPAENAEQPLGSTSKSREVKFTVPDLGHETSKK